ncbi:unnamed protein product [Durusdinium trenchii]|uniref:C3H1-type domain-containing protein n=1 Tax=Durusdinium trenchii TaxID=1381693 RepID=A0ABP0K941_9DINO
MGNLGIPYFTNSSSDACAAGEDCKAGSTPTGETRGAPLRPGSKPQQGPKEEGWWPGRFAWLIHLSFQLLSDAAYVSLNYCGTLCASIGLAARWSYWLATAVVAVFLLQLLVWTCNWIVIPVYRHSVAFGRYLTGHGQWYELAQIHGVRVFRPKWVGPRGREEWTSGFAQQEVRGRGEGREPVDLLVTDGTAIARLRHGTLRGRTHRYGFRAECDTVHSSSHRYYRNQLEGMDCRVHLCSQTPCGQPDDDCTHVVAAAVIPRHLEFDLQDEGEDEMGCQAESVAFLVNGKAMPLSFAPCKDAARGNKVKLLASDAEARFAPGVETENSREVLPRATQPTSLGQYLRAILEGKGISEALRACAKADCGPRETWEELKEQEKGKDQQDATERPIEVLPRSRASSRSVAPSAASLYRPRGTATLPLGMPELRATNPRDAYASFAAVSRPRRAGAYTDGEPLHTDETAKALQAIARAVTSKDEAASHDKGKLASIGKVEERLIFLVRGCDALTVSLGKATVGKELFHSLRSTSTQGRPQLRMMQFPVNINNRIAYGLASLNIRGKDAKAVPEYCLSAADFPLTSEEEFDGWIGCSDLKLEKRPKPPMTLNAWYRNALREAWAIACVYGTEHYASLEQAATFLLKLGEEHAYMWPAHAIFSVWEELWSRYVEELKDLDRELRRAMKEESPTFERIRFFVTAPGEDGEPWLRLPRTFFLEDPLEYFQTDVLPRHNRLLSRACWQVALKKTPGGIGTLHGGKAGEGPEACDSRPGPKPGKVDTQSKPFIGPPLTNKEAARALDHRPKEKMGARYLCWDHMCHKGCARPGTCPHAHGTAPKWESLDWAVQMQLIRRGGLRSKARLTEQQAAEQIEATRKAQVLKTPEMVNKGKKVKKVGEAEPSGDQSESKVGEDSRAPARAPASVSPCDEPPEEFTGIHPTDQESEMMDLLEGPVSFFKDQDALKPAREATVKNDAIGPPGVDRLKGMKDVDQSGLTKGFEGLLRVYLSNQLLLHLTRP